MTGISVLAFPVAPDRTLVAAAVAAAGADETARIKTDNARVTANEAAAAAVGTGIVTANGTGMGAAGTRVGVD